MSLSAETQGTILKIGNHSSPIAFTEIGEVSDFDGPGGSAAVIPVTHLRSTRIEKRMGLPDEGQFTFNGNYIGDNPGQQALKDARALRLLTRFQVILTSGETLEFDAYVLNFSMSGGAENVYKFSVTLEITGEVESSLETA